MKKVHLALKNNSYDIFIEEELLSKIGTYLSKLKLKPKIAVITDNSVGHLYGAVLKHSLRANGFKSEFILVPQGERFKTLDTARKIYKKLLDFKLSRDSTLVALGGGVIGDLAGFVASTFMRGIAFVQAPTTLLAQVDAGIGGKTAVNLEEAKNIVGTFYQPRAVFCDISTLITLPAKEIRNGLAEAIKYGIIIDHQLFEYLEKKVIDLKFPKINKPKDIKPVLDIWEKIIANSASIKAKIVEQDETEIKGARMYLNFGHTIGHAIEAINNYKNISHGEAVAQGMVCASRIAHKIKMIDINIFDRIKNLISSVNLPTNLNGLEADDIIAKLIFDKKVRDGKVNFVLPSSIGSVKIRNDVTVRILKEALRECGAK